MELKLKSQRRASQLELSRMLADLTCSHGSKRKLVGGAPAPQQVQAFGHPCTLLRLLNQPNPAWPSPTDITVQDGRRGQVQVQQAACCPDGNVHPPPPRQLGRRGRRAHALLQNIIKAAARAVLWAQGREQGLHLMILGLPCRALLPSGRQCYCCMAPGSGSASLSLFSPPCPTN